MIQQQRFEFAGEEPPAEKKAGLDAGDLAMLQSAQAEARRRMQAAAAEEPSREEIEADLRARAIAASDFLRNHAAA